MLPREKFLETGLDSLSDLDLVSILIGSGVKGRSFLKISRAVLKKFRMILRDEKEIRFEDLMAIKGVGNVVAMRIVVGIELGRRLYSQNIGSIIKVYNSKDAYEILKDMGFLKKERVDALYLNSRFELLKRETVVLGSINCASLEPRDVLSPALLLNSSFVVLAHNHPSGNSSASAEDIELTRKLLEAFNLLGIKLVDHLVIAENSWSCVDIGSWTV